MFVKEKVDANSSQIPCVWMIWVHKLNFETWILTISLKLPRVWILLNISLPFFLNIVLHYWNQTGTCLNTWIKIFSPCFFFFAVCNTINSWNVSILSLNWHAFEGIHLNISNEIFYKTSTRIFLFICYLGKSREHYDCSMQIVLEQYLAC